MKKDQYIPHEISMRSTTEVMNLIEKEGPAGYGIYWALMEYLRVQDGYIGDIQALKTLKRELKIRQTKLDKVLYGYGLFECNGNTFHSPKLNEVMKPFERRRAKIEAYKRNKEKENSLEINGVGSEKNGIVSFEVKGKEEDTSSSISSSSSAEAVEIKELPIPFIPVWEKYVDDLRQDEQWKELMAIRTGLKQQFYTLFPRIVESFKRHVRSIGNEGRILSPGDAKHYFFFFLNPSSPTYKNLILELQKPIDKGKFKYEDRDSATGQRSYCGVPVPDDAPPRPNSQAVWCEDKWIF